MSVARKVARRREKQKAAGGSYDEDQVSLQLDRAMIAAVLRCDLAAAEQLLILGANPCSQTADWPGERSPCHFAVRYVDADSAGVEPFLNGGEGGGRDVMDHKAVKCLALLSDYGADIEAEDAAGRRPLHVAAAHGCIEALRFLLESAADVTAVDNTGDTAADPARHLYALAAKVPIGQADRYDILAAPTLAKRVDALTDAVETVIAMVEFQLAEE